jgi:hypothetical protein
MTNVVHSADAMVAALSPELRPGRYVFCNAPVEAWWALKPLAMFQEVEGTSLILAEQKAIEAGIPCLDLMRLITLNVFSSLSGVGLTAAVSAALAAAGIACNMVAALNHDHVLVPADRAEEALSILRALQASAP